ncbi:MAG: glycosyltransferase family 2 protein [Rhodocyclaceae bacterium]|nr:glycosyltransferase family 2 protein [Rhodocyclaceae bacterium]
MKLSIVTTMYRSAAFLDTFHERIGAAAQHTVGDDYEIVLVNDGSPDNSGEIARAMAARDRHVCVVDLSRNFGHHAAIVAGLAHTRGELVFLLDCDLEEQPEWLSTFVAERERADADVVFGVQRQRVGSPLANAAGRIFWSALSAMSLVRIPHNPMTCRLMTRQYVDSLLEVGDRVLYLAGVFAWAGFRQTSLPLVKTPRAAQSRSTYSLSRKLVQAADSFASFSVAPLSAIFLTGLSIWSGSLAYGAWLLVRKLMNPEMILSGFTSIMLSLWFLGGTIILFLGVLGLYLAKVFQEVKRRPLYIVRSVHRGGDRA